MDKFKRSTFPFNKSLDSNARRWGSETDIGQSSLPPILSNDKKNGKYSSACGRQTFNRPPTPNPGRKEESMFSWGKTSRNGISPASSSQRLSLSLDFKSKGGDFRRYSSGFADGSPEGWPSPRPVRSLPPSPTIQRSHRLHRYLRRLSSDSEQCIDKLKDDRILKWIRDVSEGIQPQNDEDEDDVFNHSSFENNDSSDGSNCNTGLPVIKEGRKS